MVFLGMKRAREDNITTMANCLMLLSRTNDLGTVTNAPTRVFECKTCNRQFPSFQALGGHRASHKKPRLMAGESNAAQIQSPAKPKTHECSVCGQEFAIGQALGGHMRRHRATMEDNQTTPLSLFPTQVGGGVPVLKRSNSKRVMQQENQASPLSLFPTQVPKVLKRSTSRRVLSLDLNLAPPENDCKYERADSILY